MYIGTFHDNKKLRKKSHLWKKYIYIYGAYWNKTTFYLFLLSTNDTIIGKNLQNVWGMWNFILGTTTVVLSTTNIFPGLKIFENHLVNIKQNKSYYFLVMN